MIVCYRNNNFNYFQGAANQVPGHCISPGHLNATGNMSSHAASMGLQLHRIFNHHSIQNANTFSRHIFNRLHHCYTADLGLHHYKCDDPNCNHVHQQYHSCGNRHCPKIMGRGTYMPLVKKRSNPKLWRVNGILATAENFISATNYLLMQS